MQGRGDSESPKTRLGADVGLVIYGSAKRLLVMAPAIAARYRTIFRRLKAVVFAVFWQSLGPQSLQRASERGQARGITNPTLTNPNLGIPRYEILFEVEAAHGFCAPTALAKEWSHREITR